MWIVVPALWALAITLIVFAVPAVLACGFGLATLDWYFPGDADWFDLALLQSLPLAFVGSFLAWLSYRTGPLSHCRDIPEGLKVALLLPAS